MGECEGAAGEAAISAFRVAVFAGLREDRGIWASGDAYLQEIGSKAAGLI